MKIHIVIIVSWFYCIGNISTDCEINPFRNNAPLVINSRTNSLIYPKRKQTTIKLATDDIVEFSCPGSRIISGKAYLESSVRAECDNSNIFTINRESVEWDSLVCRTEPKVDVRELKTFELDEHDANINCFNSQRNVLKILQIGFNINEGRFLNFIDICFNTADKIPVYSHFNIPSSVNYKARNVQNPFFEQDENIYKIGVEIHRLFKNGQYTVNDIVGLNGASEKYINRAIYINKGHLAAKADFVYEPLQKGTFRYINVAPQWCTFNAGNWNQAEIDVRNFADRNAIDLKVWTGTYGNSMLMHEATLEPQKLYLFNSGVKALPVPAVFWKLVYEPLSERGIVLVGHNNPYEGVTQESQKLCERDVSSQINWLQWTPTDIVKGFSYACAADDNKFRTLISVLPKLEIKGLLK